MKRDDIIQGLRAAIPTSDTTWGCYKRQFINNLIRMLQTREMLTHAEFYWAVRWAFPQHANPMELMPERERLQ